MIAIEVALEHGASSRLATKRAPPVLWQGAVNKPGHPFDSFTDWPKSPGRSFIILLV